MSKVVVDGRPDQFFGVFGRPLVQVDAQFDRSIMGELLGPAYDEFFRVVVEILFNEGRRVHRIEELVHVAQLQTYGVRMLPILSSKMHTKISNIGYVGTMIHASAGLGGSGRMAEHWQSQSVSNRFLTADCRSNKLLFPVPRYPGASHACKPF